jgi:dsRNA-specific ribonuclease
LQPEEILDYDFWDITLLQEALTKTATRIDPSYNRLEYLGDSVLDVVSAEFWLRRGAVPDLASQSVDNSTLQALCLELGLDRFIRNLPIDKDRRIRAAKAAREDAKRITADNKEYWSQWPQRHWQMWWRVSLGPSSYSGMQPSVTADITAWSSFAIQSSWSRHLQCHCH